MKYLAPSALGLTPCKKCNGDQLVIVSTIKTKHVECVDCCHQGKKARLFSDAIEEWGRDG